MKKVEHTARAVLKDQAEAGSIVRHFWEQSRLINKSKKIELSLAGKRRGFSSRTGSVGIDCKDRSLVTSVPKSKLLMQTQHKNKIHSTTWRHAPSVKHITLAYIGVFMVDIPQL